MKAMAPKRVGEEKRLKDTRALRHKEPSAWTQPLLCLPAPQPRISSCVSWPSPQQPSVCSHSKQRAATSGPEKSQHRRPVQQGGGRDTHTPKSGNENHATKRQGDGRHDGEFAWLSTAGVCWDTTDAGGPLQARRKAGTNEVHMLAQIGSGLSCKSSLTADMRLGL